MHRPNTKKHIPFIAVIVLLIFLHFTGIIKPAEDLIMKALNPVFLSLHKASSYLRITYNERSDKENLINKINILEARVTNLIVENARFKSLDEENQVLREYLKFSKDNEAISSTIILPQFITYFSIHILNTNTSNLCPIPISENTYPG